MAEKRYFWIKLMDDFLWGDKVKFLMNQKNGAEYVVMYEMLCSLAKNSNGRLVKKLGNILLELNLDAIYGELKGYFEYDTIVVAMSLFAKLDLLYQEEENGVFVITDFDNMVGSECASAARVRRLRENARQNQLQAPLQSNENGVTSELQGALQEGTNCNSRDKSIEYRDNSLLKILKKKILDAGMYTGVHDNLIDEVLEALVDGTKLKKTITFNGAKYDAQSFEKIAKRLTVNDVCRVVNRLLQRKGEIDNRKLYIQGALADICLGGSK